MTLIKMLYTCPGSPNGIAIVKYEQGQEYEINDELADIFVNQMKVAVFVQEEVEQPIVEQKAIPEAPINKAISSVPDIKSGFTRRK